MAQGSTSMAVDPKLAGRDAARAAGRSDEFDDPTEDLSSDDAPVRSGDVGSDSPLRAVPEPGTEAAEVDPFEPGRVLCGRYELERVVGRGGFSVVLGARDLRRQAAGDTQTRVAIKVLRPELRRDDDARQRLTAEFRQLQQLSHPGIVRVYDLDRHGDDWFLVMELLEGTSLAALIRQGEGEPLATERALAIVRDGGAALAWAHGRGVVHGDVKPGNVFVTRDEGVRLLDFGTASALAEPAEGRAAGFATPAYASPQVLQGREPTAVDDVYSLACVAFELLAGTHPFERLDAREAWAREMHPAATPGLDPSLRLALESGLVFDRERRPADMEAFLRLLDPAEAVAAAPVAVTVGSAVATGRRAGPPAMWVAAIAGLAAVVVAFLMFRGEPPDAPVVPATALDPPGNTSPSTAEAGQHAAEEALTSAGSRTNALPTSTPAPDATPAPQAASPAATPGPPAQRIEFASGPVLVSRSAPAAAISLRRNAGSSGRTVVRWRIDEGSARSGRDFAGPLSGTLVLADGQEAGTVFVPLAAAPGATEDRGFSVTIESVLGPAIKGERTRVDVTLRSFVRDDPRSLAARN